jgi:hypothetical protein
MTIITLFMGCAWLLGRPRTLEERLRERRDQLSDVQLELRRIQAEGTLRQATLFRECINDYASGGVDAARPAALRVARATDTLTTIRAGMAAIEEIQSHLNSASASVDLATHLAGHVPLLRAIQELNPTRALNRILSTVRRQSDQLDRGGGGGDTKAIVPASTAEKDVHRILQEAERRARRVNDDTRIIELSGGDDDDTTMVLLDQPQV